MRGERILLVGIGVVAGFLYSNFLFDAIFSQNHDWFTVVSDLATSGTPMADLIRITDVICGVLVLVLLPGIRAALPPGRWRRAALWLTAVFAVGSIVAAVVPLPCDTDAVCKSTVDELQRLVHDGASVVSAAALFLGAVAVALAVADRRHWVRRAAWLTFWIGGIVGILLFGGFALLDPSSWESGVAQRFQIVAMSVWIVCLAVLAATDGLANRRAVARREGARGGEPD